jgi:16S rRNA (guanine(966)-N(2))-methyltransferase RsmD
MRIIAGTKRGTNLFSPKGDVSRPIIDRVKESLFNVLYSYDMPEGKVVADLFSGVGSMGLESLSRGARFALFVEKDDSVAAVLRRNIEKCSFVKASKIIKANAFKVGAKVEAEIGKYDLVFVDPPYVKSRDVGPESALTELMNVLAEQLADDGLIVVRTEKQIELMEQYGKFQVLERRVWGTMAVTILRARKDD